MKRFAATGISLLRACSLVPLSLLAIPVSAAQDPPELGLVSGSVLSAAGIVHVEGQLLVSWAADADGDRVEASIIGLGGFVSQRFPRLRIMLVELPAGSRAQQQQALYATLPGVRYAELNAVGMGGVITLPPNDTWFGSQWQLNNTVSNLGTSGADVEALAGWDIEMGDSGVVLAILDTGIDFNSPEFIGRTLPGWDFVNGDADPSADHPHGIWVSALAAATADNGFGVAGLDRECTILPVKVLNAANGGSVAWLVAGLDYCAQNAADVVSMSLINFPNSQALEDALQKCRDAGCILVACAGNGGLGDADVSWPGASPLTISVGATTWDDVRASFSGTGEALDFVAPGQNTVTLAENGTDSTAYFSGCSAATPLAAAIVSLLKAQDTTLTQVDAFELLRVGAEDRIGTTKDKIGRDDDYGWGRVNARASLDPLYERYCSPAVPNSTGLHAVLTAHGGRAAVDNDLWITASRLPQNIPGYLLASHTQSSGTIPPGSQGSLCLGGKVARFAKQLKMSGNSGSFRVKIDLTTVPLHPPVQAGETWNFQGWHRDSNPGTTSNFTDAITITFS